MVSLKQQFRFIRPSDEYTVGGEALRLGWAGRWLCCKEWQHGTEPERHVSHPRRIVEYLERLSVVIKLVALGVHGVGAALEDFAIK